MKIPLLALRLPVLVFCLGSLGLSSGAEEVRQGEDGTTATQPELGKRLYDFGLGKRAYRYASEFKRLPMYDFGLGKRAKQYSFGLGKRSETEEEDEFENYLDSGDHPEIDVYDDEQMQSPEKRQRLAYSFGLGKRPRYEFGLGKRARQYSFGLGKRERLYSFGLGKRSPKMYGFGLGKRGEPEYSLEKREVSPNELKAVSQDNGEENSAESNSTAVVDSHEVMGHGDRQRSLQKRSPRQYSFGLGKRDDDEDYQSSPFSRQYRKPSYSFGLGKRRLIDNYGQNYQL